MTMFALALGAFILLHVGVAATPLRAGLVKSIGEGRYRGLFSLASVVVFVWMIWSFGAARIDPANGSLWSPPAWTRGQVRLSGRNSVCSRLGTRKSNKLALKI